MGGRSNYRYESSLREGARRAITPTPDSHKSKVSTPVRRARTPGPDWGKYNSDDEELNDNKDGISHCRQPSYIFAVDGDEAPCTCDNNNQQLYVGSQEPALPKPAPLDNVTLPHSDGGYHAREQEPRNAYVRQGHGQGMDLLGSIPSSIPQQSQANAGYQGYSNGPVDYYRQQNHQHPIPQQPIPQQQHQQQKQYYTQAQYAAMERNHFVNPAMPVSTASSVARVNEIQKTDPYSMGQRRDMGYSQSYPTQNGLSTNQSYPMYSSAGHQPYQSSQTYSTSSQSQASQATHSSVAQGILDCNPTLMNPVLKRSKSMENGELLSGQQSAPHPQRTAVSRSRPQSARPYDYPNGRPVVEQKPPIHVARVRTCSEGNGLDEPDGMFPARQNSAPVGYSQGNMAGPANPRDDQDIYGTYISRKTVKNILHYQGIGKNNATPTMPVQPNTEPTPHANNKKWQHNDFIRDLKVDIPDNASIGSHKDSGYRSGGSSGDRNSNSSTSSVSMESPTVDHYTRGYPPNSYKPSHNPLTQTDNRCHSSTESLSSTQSGHSYSTVKTMPGQQRLGKIPENISSGYKAADFKSQSAGKIIILFYSCISFPLGKNIN